MPPRSVAHYKYRQPSDEVYVSRCSPGMLERFKQHLPETLQVFACGLPEIFCFFCERLRKFDENGWIDHIVIGQTSGWVHHQMWSRLSTWTRQLQVLRRYYQNQAQREYRRLQYLQLYAILSRSFSTIYADSMQLLTILVFIVNEWPFYGCQHQLNRNRMSCQKRIKQRNGHERWTWPLDMISVRSLSTDDPIELSHWLWEHIFEWWLW